MGRNMFSPLRGPWANEDWKGWWGDNPPFKHPVFVLTHHPRPTLEFQNGTSFHFVNGSLEQVLKQAQAAAGCKDVKVNGGVSTVRAFWKAWLLDELHLVMSPVFVGEGERLLGRAGGGKGLPGGRLRSFGSGRALQDRQEERMTTDPRPAREPRAIASDGLVVQARWFQRRMTRQGLVHAYTSSPPAERSRKSPFAPERTGRATRPLAGRKDSRFGAVSSEKTKYKV
jgi:dihydrofolate reductase